MSAKDFKFVSPGVQIEEIDNSQLPEVQDAIGPLVIGRSRRGPAMQPVKVDSFSEFVTIFGNPVGGEEASDLWRSGVPTAPTFAAYAAQAWLKNNSPLTFIRLLGDQSPDAAATDLGKAGWKSADFAAATGGGAYGLYIFNSGSASPLATQIETVDGTLAAIFYATAGAVTLSGAMRGAPAGLAASNADVTATTASATLVEAPAKQFTANIINGSGVVTEKINFNFDQGSQNYIRKVFNTNATLTNTRLVDTDSANLKTYWLGQTFEREVSNAISSASGYGLILRLGRTGYGIANGGDFKFATQAPRSGWFFSQDLRATPASTTIADNTLEPAIFDPSSLVGTSRLFKVHGLSSGEEIQRKFKISIEDLRYSKNDNTPYGTFSLAIRDARDNDNAKIYVERFTGLTLDPNAESYIGKQIGDRYYQWSDDQRRLIEYGTYPNRSKIIRMEMANAVDTAQVAATSLPFGVEGPLVLSDITITGSNGKLGTGSLGGTPTAPLTAGGGANIFAPTSRTMTGDTDIILSTTVASEADTAKIAQFTGSIKHPTVPLRLSASDGDISDPTEAYFGAQFQRSATSTVYEPSLVDLTYVLPSGGHAFSPVANNTKTSWYFSLDDLVLKENTKNLVFYRSGSRAAGDSITARTGSYQAVLDAGFDRFTSPMFGGYNGFDITEKEPFNDTTALVAGTSETASSMFYSVKKAVDMFADPEFIEANMLLAPGIVNQGLTTHMIQTAEARGDALAVIDPRGGYVPSSENANSEQMRIAAGTGAGKGGISQHVVDVGDAMSLRNLNSSYGATYYPWVRISDTITGRGIWAPPSVAALGAMSFSENKAALWFAPAGFSRGGLTDGAAGIPVTNVRSRLTSKERDYLYERNINPIASFPSEGIVIFGQKTLQATPSALDRINVRRLMIFVKKEISRIASGLLFEQNVQATWDSFTGQVNPFLDNIKFNFGLDDFKVLLDSTTTTAEMIDRNTIYAKIFLKPTKAVEFFAIDFVITNSGAGFED